MALRITVGGFFAQSGHRFYDGGSSDRWHRDTEASLPNVDEHSSVEDLRGVRLSDARSSHCVTAASSVQAMNTAPIGASRGVRSPG